MRRKYHPTFVEAQVAKEPKGSDPRPKPGGKEKEVKGTKK